MARRPYVASGRMEDGATLRLALAALAGGAVAGAVEGFIATWFDLLLVFPALVGLVAGAAAAKVVVSSNVRAPVLAALLAGLGGLAGQAAKQEVQYQRFLRSATPHEQPGAEGPTLDELLQATTGKTGRAGYLVLRSQQGTTIRRHGSGGPTLRGPAFWVLLGLEFLLAGAIAFGVTWGAASNPFCERCKKWYGPDTPLATGAGDRKTLKTSVAALEASDWQRFADTLGQPDTKLLSSVLIAACPGCTDNDRRLTLRQVRRPGKSKEKSEARFVSMIRPDELRALESALSQRRADS